MREAKIGNTNRLGKTHSEETKAKISASQPNSFIYIYMTIYIYIKRINIYIYSS
jgi:hypothetical protein